MLNRRQLLLRYLPMKMLQTAVLEAECEESEKMLDDTLVVYSAEKKADRRGPLKGCYMVHW